MTVQLEESLVEAPYPFQAHLGYRLTGWSEDYCRVEMPIRKFIENRYGIPHGGIYGVLLDTVMGFAGCYTGDPNRRKLAMTLSMNVNFLSRPTGKLLIADGWRKGGGRSTFFADSRITDDAGEVVATGTGVFRYRRSA